MPVDPYALCPCGSGKKLKFCCTDLVGEIEKIHRMVEGDQPRAALRHVEQTLAQHPGRASLLDLKASLELALGELDSARGTVDEFLTTDPDNPSAHACQALLLAATDQGRAAVDPLQGALDLVERDMPQRVFEAIGAVGRALLVAGHVVAAQAHLTLHVAIAPQDDSRARELLLGLNHYSGLPLLLRDALRMPPFPVDVPWRTEADRAARLSDNGKWRQAVEIIDRLGREHGAVPSLVYSRAVLGGRLADDRALVAGLHAYAQLDVPTDDAVEAEAVAQLLDPDLKERKIDSVLHVYQVDDLDALVASLTADGRAVPFELDPAELAGSDQPRPRNAFVLLDRPVPESGQNITRDQVPRLVGVVTIFGRQTDRAERLELTLDHDERYETTIAALREMVGSALGAMSDERVVASTSPTEQVLNWRWHFPPDTPPALRRTLIDQERHAALVERWPDVPSAGLAGATPRSAAGDPQRRVPLAAAVLILEQGSNAQDKSAFAELRDVLQLPQPEPIHADGKSVGRLPLVRVPRLITAEASDDDLSELYRRALVAAATVALAHLAREAVKRPSIADKIPPAEAYRRLIVAETDSARALALIDEARRNSEAAGQSTATWDLAELELHLADAAVDKAQATLDRIQQLHFHNPEVVSAVYRLLYEVGAIAPDGQPAAQAVPAMAAATPAEQKSSQIWTPDSDRPSGGKSSLWTPS